MTTPTIAVKESLDDLKGIGPSTGISGFKLVYVTGEGIYRYTTGDQSSNVPDSDNLWVAPSEDTSGKSGAWEKLLNEISEKVLDEDDMSSDSDTAVPTQQSVKAYADTKARIATGTYTGDGTTSQGITGVGFQPAYVKIWSNAAVGGGASVTYETTPEIVDNDGEGVAVQTSDAGDLDFIKSRLISLDADGFTVDDSGADADPNTNGETYAYLAIG